MENSNTVVSLENKDNISKTSSKKFYKIILYIIISLIILLTLWIIIHRFEKLHGSQTMSQTNSNLIKTTTILIPTAAGRPYWGQNNLIVYSIYSDPAGRYGGEIYTMNPDGSNQVCITCNKPQISHLSNDIPAWDPNGKYILFQSVDPSLSLPSNLQGNSKLYTEGGIGFNNNIWLTTADGTKFFQLTHVKDGEAILHPTFSRDGKKLYFAQRFIGSTNIVGQWKLRVADFIDDITEPNITNIRDYQPLGGGVLYESHDISPDGKSILFSSNVQSQDGQKAACSCTLAIWRMDIASGQATLLTSSKDVWNEHAFYSPDGQKIIWSSSQGYPFTLSGQALKTLKTDLWIMNSDGSNKQQLTFYNDPNSPSYNGDRIGFSKHIWSPDGMSVVSMFNDSASSGYISKIVRFDFFNKDASSQ